MKRRDLLTAMFGFAYAAAVIDPSQAQTVRRKRLGYLSGGKQGTGAYTSDILKASLRDLGWRENETIDIDERWADGDVSRLARLASELVALRPDVIACTGTSEAKALLRVLPELRKFDQEGVSQFLTFGCTLEQRTLFRGVQLLPGASVWSFENGKCQKEIYFSPETWESQSVLPAESFAAQFQETFKGVLPRYFESQSRVGVSLTAGLDSRMIMACLETDG